MSALVLSHFPFQTLKTELVFRSGSLETALGKSENVNSIIVIFQLVSFAEILQFTV